MTENNPPPARPYVSVHLALVRDDTLLLMQRKNSVDHNGKYVFVAGKVDENETPIQAAVREAQEEIGVTISPGDLKPVTVIYRAAVPYKGEKVDVVEIFFQTDKWIGEPKICEPDRCSDIGFYLVKDLPKDLSDSVEAFLSHVSAGYIEISAERWDKPTTHEMRQERFTKSR